MQQSSDSAYCGVNVTLTNISNRRGLTTFHYEKRIHRKNDFQQYENNRASFLQPQRFRKEIVWLCWTCSSYNRVNVSANFYEFPWILTILKNRENSRNITDNSLKFAETFTRLQALRKWLTLCQHWLSKLKNVMQTKVRQMIQTVPCVTKLKNEIARKMLHFLKFFLNSAH